MRLVYSPDDRGWYWERRDWKKSQIFRTVAQAKTALRKGKIVWQD